MSIDLRDRLQAILGSAYSIERELGEGGMAVVFLARDNKHGRLVAIKVLRPELSASLWQERFFREIQVAARLTHPHILPLHDSGSSDGLVYYITPFVAGESVRDRLRREGQLPLADALGIARDVANALACAHDADVIHRDIKPENILLSGVHAVVADFGIARAIATAADGRLTATGLAVGTPAYMSPEQSVGDPRLDQRSDIYSLGCVLYEMLAGEPPFTGPSAQAVIARHARDPVPSVRTVRPAVSPELERVLDRALAKVPADRFTSARELAAELGRVLAAEAAHAGGQSLPAQAARSSRRRTYLVASIAAVAVAGVGAGYIAFHYPGESALRRVAVAPLDDRTNDPQLAQLGDLAADWITREVARVQSFNVTAASVARQAWLASRATPGTQLRAMVDATGADVVVSGRYVVDADSVRFTAEIIDARTGALITSVAPLATPIHGPVTAVGALADRVAAALTAQLGPQRTEREARVSNPPTLEAFREYQEGMDLFSRGEWQQSIEHFKQATAFDSTYPPPVVWASMAYANLGRLGMADTLLTSIAGTRERLTPLERVSFEWQRAIVRGDREAHYRWAEEGFRLQPRSWSYPLAHNAVKANRPRRALEVLPLYDRGSRFGRNWAPFWIQYGDAYHLIGDYAAELDLAGRWRSGRAAQLRDVATEIRAQAARGQIAAVDTLLEAALSLSTQGEGRNRMSRALVHVNAVEELRAHGHEHAARAVVERAIRLIRTGTIDDGDQYSLARALYLGERWAEARALLDSLRQRDARNIDYAGLLGATYARLGDVARAAAADSALAAMTRPYLNGAHTRWRAQIAAVRGDRASAVRLLRQAAAEGIPVGIELHAQMDFESLRGYPPFEAFIKPRG